MENNEKQTIKGVGGYSQILGETALDFPSSSGKIFYTRFSLYDIYAESHALQFDGIIGTQFLFPFESQINMGKRTLYLPHVNWTLSLINFEEASKNHTLTINAVQQSETRIAALQKQIRIKHLKTELKEKTSEIINENVDIFFIASDSIENQIQETREIHTTSEKPLTSKIYKFPHAHRQRRI